MEQGSIFVPKKISYIFIIEILEKEFSITKQRIINFKNNDKLRRLQNLRINSNENF